jgi:hypothetical protein
MNKMLRQYPAVLIASLLALLLVSAEQVDLIRLTIINKSGMEIAVKLNSISQPCIYEANVNPSRFYYLPVPEGSKELPNTKVYTIERNTYFMQVLYLETYDPVYGFKCVQPPSNTIRVTRNMRVVIPQCKTLPVNAGEPSMRKYLPYPLSISKATPFIKRYWITRFIN